MSISAAIWGVITLRPERWLADAAAYTCRRSWRMYACPFCCLEGDDGWLVGMFSAGSLGTRSAFVGVAEVFGNGLPALALSSPPDDNCGAALAGDGGSPPTASIPPSTSASPPPLPLSSPICVIIMSSISFIRDPVYPLCSPVAVRSACSDWTNNVWSSSCDLYRSTAASLLASVA